MNVLQIPPPKTRQYEVVLPETSTTTPPETEPRPATIQESPARMEPVRLPLRTAWVEVNLARLRRNFELIHADKPRDLRLLSVVKDDGYGHGILEVARMALENGASHLAVSTLHEAMTLRDAGIQAPILLLGERHETELPWCVHHNLGPCLNDTATAQALAREADRAGRRVPVHVKVDTGMARYGVRWTEALDLVEFVSAQESLKLEGVLTHFAQSDELDKTYANLQLSRFNEVLNGMQARGLRAPLRHACNSGGFLDLPQAHFDMVRLGILPLGVFPSRVCRRIEGILPVMTVKTRIAAIRNIQSGDCVGYGMHFKAAETRRLAVLPVGYGDGYPRVRNTGAALVCGKRAPVRGGNAMDATMVDITDIPEAGMWSEAVLMGQQGGEEITARDLARWKGTVTYEALVCWRSRLPRVYLDE